MFFCDLISDLFFFKFTRKQKPCSWLQRDHFFRLRITKLSARVLDHVCVCVCVRLGFFKLCILACAAKSDCQEP